ncbi:hypothetical protein GCM10008957_32340 [Deinococcus ruber]|uniref:Uncharacterized protein n=1 Tax=Deinococcus ruber TaxID=1848197 RepID=A0A918CDV7_9DEIO|nr:hypothetical protein GCM10008957_32340 [Deinococcus ruber]
MSLLHELWKDIGGEQYPYETFCLAGPRGANARSLLSPTATLIWSVQADSHFEAMSKYYTYKGWGEYTTEDEWDSQPYPREWYGGSDSRELDNT